ncbi:GNAT family N-acetyltransferase [Allomuricauda sp. d1]|uniref:GNAT family N-acetyltransferase n=1 Tax=Allomuricauda sp. d1 TaxID=3136725 RepID=UPI0031CF500A
MVKIIRAATDRLEQVVPLFDQYRVFYGKKSDLPKAKAFLTERFSNQENVLFLALQNENAVGFTQLYQTFSSVSLQPFYILNDLFVDASCRNEGIGALLLKEAQSFCKEQSFKGLALETAIDNPAQKLYEKLGWKKDTDFLHYFWSASDKV